jgi:type I restriction enzyme S subunit
MKDSRKITEIPKGWRKVKLASLGTFSKGASVSKDQLSDSGLNAVRYGEIYTKHHFRIDKIYSFIPKEVAEQSVQIQYGDLVFAGSGETIDEIGKSAVYLLNEEAYAGGDTIILRPKTANSIYLSYHLNSSLGRKRLRELGQGQSVVHIYKSDIEDIELQIPDKPEQDRIVNVLVTWDRAIEKLEHAIKIKNAIKKGLMQELITGQKRISGFKESWKNIEIGNFCDIKRGGSPRPIDQYMTDDKDGLNWLKIGDVPKGSRYIKHTSGRIRKEGLHKTTVVEEGDFILSNSMSFGRPYIMKTSACIHDGWLALKNISKDVDKDFLYYLLSSQLIQNKFRSISAGSGVLNLKKESVAQVVVQIPEIKEQEYIAKILGVADDEIDKMEAKLSMLLGQKRHLLNNLIAGTIRTPETLSIPK